VTDHEVRSVLDASSVVATEPAQAVSLWRLPQVARLAVLTFLGFTSFGLTLSALPSWVARGGSSAASAGAVTAVLLAATVLVQGFVPALERRCGTARVLAAGLIALGGPAPLYLLSSQHAWVMAVSALRGCGFAVLTVVGATLTARVAPPGRLGEVVGGYGLAIAVPNLAAVPAGAALTLAGHFAAVAVLAAVPLLALPLVGSLCRESSSSASQRPPSEERDRWDVLRAAVPPSASLLVVTLAGGAVMTFLPIERPHGALAPSALLVVGITSAASRWRDGTLADRLGGHALLPGSLALAAGGMLGVAAGLALGHGTGATTAGLLTGAAVFGVGFGATQNLTQVAAFARAGNGGTAAASAVWNAAFDVGTGIGAYAVGAIAAAAGGFAWTYAGCAALIAVMLPVAAMAGHVH
jgi:predicted MFS family arabinose efflux permease